MNRKLIGGLTALGIVGAISTMLAPGAMAQGYGYRTWNDGPAIRADFRVIRGEDHRIAADRAALRRDYYSGNHYAATRDRARLHRDLRIRGNAQFNASVNGGYRHHR